MLMRWLGHSCFYIESSQGTKIVIDPFDAPTGYQPPTVEADLCLCTHQHHDHHAVEVLSGKPEVIDTPGRHEFKEIKIRGLKSYHDRNKGRDRGENVIFFLEVDGVRLAHCGDLGVPMDAMMMADFGRVDALMVPVGGTYTITAKDAWAIVQMVVPKIVIPMHYQTAHSKIELATVDKFLACAGLEEVPTPVKQLDLPEDLPALKKQVVMLTYPGMLTE